MNKKNKTLKFFSMLYGLCPKGWIELRPFTKNFKLFFEGRKWFSVNHLQRLIDQVWKLKDRYHLFYGVAVRDEQSKRKRKASQEYVSLLPALFADLDFKDYRGGKKEALEIIQDFPFPPSAIISSGHGYHCYYFLDPPYHLKKDISKIKRLLKIIQDRLLQADSTSDPTRILRVPYTFNLKDPKNPLPVTIRTLEARRYTVQDFEDQFAGWLTQPGDIERIKQRKNKPNVEPKGKEGEIEVDTLKVSDRIKRFIREGKKEDDGYKSRSEMDQAVITALLSAGYSKQVIFQIFEEHPEGIGEKYFEKGSGGKKYLIHSIQSAKDYLAASQPENYS